VFGQYSLGVSFPAGKGTIWIKMNQKFIDDIFDSAYKLKI